MHLYNVCLSIIEFKKLDLGWLKISTEGNNFRQDCAEVLARFE